MRLKLIAAAVLLIAACGDVRRGGLPPVPGLEGTARAAASGSGGDGGGGSGGAASSAQASSGSGGAIAPGDPLWSRRFGDTDVDAARSVATDSAGDVVLLGSFSGTVDFGGGPLTSAGSGDIFLLKLDADGNHRWSRSFGSPSGEAGISLAIDGADNIVIVGNFSDALDLGGGALTSAGQSDFFVAKYGADGSHLWSRRFGGASGDAAADVAIGAAGRAIVVGEIQGTSNLGGGPVSSFAGSDAFVASYGADGNYVWGAVYGSGGFDGADGVAVDGSGHIAVVGHFDDNIDLGGGFVSQNGVASFIAKLEADGQHLWSQAIRAHAYGVAADDAGNVAVTGTFGGTVDFGGGNNPIESNGLWDIFVASYDTNGQHVWSRGMGGSHLDSGLSAAFDSLGYLLVCGHFEDIADFGGGPQLAVASDVFVAKYDGAGDHIWSAVLSGPGAERAFSVTADSWGNVLAAGYFSETLSSDGEMLTSAGGLDAFVVKLAP